jgi:hypothetical protein
MTAEAVRALYPAAARDLYEHGARLAFDMCRLREAGFDRLMIVTPPCADLHRGHFMGIEVRVGDVPVPVVAIEPVIAASDARATGDGGKATNPSV